MNSPSTESSPERLRKPTTVLGWVATVATPLLIGGLIAAARQTNSESLLTVAAVTALAYWATARGSQWTILTAPIAGLLGWLGPVLANGLGDGLGLDDWKNAGGLAGLLWFAAEAGQQLAIKSEQSARYATTDSLTGLLNQRGLKERLEAELNRCQRTQARLAVAFIDCDGFKKLNDFRGHLAGDKFLQTIAEQVQSSTRRYDSVARWGGDEFVILFPECDADAARVAMTRIQGQLSLRAVRENWPVTWSAGVAIVQAPVHASFVLHAADQLMYEAKRTSAGALVVREVSEAALSKEGTKSSLAAKPSAS